MEHPKFSRRYVHVARPSLHKRDEFVAITPRMFRKIKIHIINTTKMRLRMVDTRSSLFVELTNAFNPKNGLMKEMLYL